VSELAVQSDVTVVAAREVDTAVSHVDHVPLAVRSFGLTDAGRARERNEDQFLVAELVKALQVRHTSLPQPRVRRCNDRSYLFVVADGMGGHAGGERASALAIDCVEGFVLETFKWFSQLRGKDHDRMLADFRSALGQANARVLAEAAQNPELHGMGTTLTLAYVLNDELFVAHAGDSRCYLFRAGLLYRLTSDHTLVEEMVQRGLLSAEDAVSHRWRHVITNVVGGDTSEVKVELHKVRLEPGDRVLLCSDGLTGMVAEEQVAQVLQDEPDPEPACRLLVDRANEAGGKDNITVIVARFEPLAA
jgi:protein phosphatase